VVRNKAAEICEKYLSKGDKVYVEGRLKNRQWQGEDGNTRYTTEVHVQDFTFLTNKNEGGGQSQNPGNQVQEPTVSQSSVPAQSVAEDDDDDLPF
jgi:single-strand DNA-binding protein